MILMKASDALGLVQETERQEKEEAARKQADQSRREDEEIARAPEWAQSFFEGNISNEIKKAASEKRRSVWIDTYSPHTRTGEVQNKCLVKILHENGFAVKGPEYIEVKGHDPDWGHYDWSHWSIEISW